MCFPQELPLPPEGGQQKANCRYADARTPRGGATCRDAGSRTLHILRRAAASGSGGQMSGRRGRVARRPGTFGRTPAETVLPTDDRTYLLLAEMKRPATDF